MGGSRPCSEKVGESLTPASDILLGKIVCGVDGDDDVDDVDDSDEDMPEDSVIGEQNWPSLLSQGEIFFLFVVFALTRRGLARRNTSMMTRDAGRTTMLPMTLTYTAKYEIVIGPNVTLGLLAGSAPYHMALAVIVRKSTARQQHRR